MEQLKILTELIALGSFLGALYLWLNKLADGCRCQLRSEMLRIYYHNREKGQIRQYECENFALLYEAYKALKGNSFIDRIRDEVTEWEVIS